MTDTDLDDLRDLLRAVRAALDAGVRRDAIASGVAAVLNDEARPVEATLILKRLASRGTGRRRAS